MMHLVHLLSIGTVDFDATYHNLGTHQHCNHAIGYEQYSASLAWGGIRGKHILIGNESESLAKTSGIYHLLTVQEVEILIMIHELIL